MRDYPRLDVVTFGRHLLEADELDPVYVALYRARLHRDLLARWLVAYWCYYDTGVASYMAEHKGPEFWRLMEIAAANEQPAPTGERWRRAKERRHFRGESAIKAVARLRERYGDRPEGMVEYVAGDGGPFVSLAKRATKHYKFGPWIAFKIGDMVERVIGVPVDFSEADVFMFPDPKKAALMLWRRAEGLPDTAKPKDKKTETQIIRQVVNHLGRQFADYTAPPRHDRPVALQEIETVLCCWKSHVNGHYPLYNDIEEINESMVPWRDHSAVARTFADAMPKGRASQPGTETPPRRLEDDDQQAA